MEQLVSLEAAGAQLDMSVRGLRNWLASGKIDYVKVGRLVRIKQSDINAFIEANTKKKCRSVEPVRAGFERKQVA